MTVVIKVLKELHDGLGGSIHFRQQTFLRRLEERITGLSPP
jgi:hypothetical protein